MATGFKPAMTSLKTIFGQGLVLLVSNVGSGLIQVAYTFALARLLLPADYGAYIALVSAFGILGVATTGIQPTVARRFARRKEPVTQSSLIQIATGAGSTPTIIATAILAGFLIVATPSIQFEFGLSSPWPVWLLVPMTALIVVTPALRGAVQGSRHFTALASLSTIDIVSRAVIGVTLGWLGGGITGAIGAQLAGSFIGLLATIAYLRRWTRTRPNQTDTANVDTRPESLSRHTRPKPMTDPETQSMIASGCILVMLSLDAALVGRFFNAEDTATYSAVTILGRSQFYLSSTIATLLLPYASSAGPGNQKTALGYGLAVTGGLNAAGLLVLITIPDMVIRLLYGEAYASAAPLLWHFAVHATLLSLANVVATYLIGSGNRWVGTSAIACAVFQISAVSLWHPTLDSVILGLGAGSGAFLLITLVVAYVVTSDRTPRLVGY